MDTLQDKVAVVTGAGSGIGHAIANSLAARGAHIVAVDIDADRLATAAEELASLDVGVLPCNVDISQADAFDKLLGTTLERFGHVDIVVNNVGVLTNGLPQDIPIIEWQRILDINLMSCTQQRCVPARAARPTQRAHRQHRIVRGALHLRLRPLAIRGDQGSHRADQRRSGDLPQTQEHRGHPAMPRPGAHQTASNIPTFGGGAPLRTPGDHYDLLTPEPVGELVAEES